MASRASRRPTPRKADMERAYAFAERHGLKVAGIRIHNDGGFSLDFGERPANDDAIDKELAELERRHGEG